MSLAILFHLLCAQHVSDINISIFSSLRLCWWITTSVALFFKDGCFSISVTLRCVVVCFVWCVLSPCCSWWNKIASDIKLVFHSSTIAMMHGPINVRNIRTQDFIVAACISQRQLTHQLLHIHKIVYIETFKIAPTCFDPKIIFRELHCSSLKSHF